MHYLYLDDQGHRNKRVPGRFSGARVGDTVSVGIDMATGEPTGEAWIVQRADTPTPRPQPLEHTIYARDFVLGMLYHWGTRTAPARVESVSRKGKVVELEWSTRPYGSQPRADEEVIISLAGLSPCWILCSCKDTGDPARCSDPEHHAAGCPVAGVEGVHEGLVLWPRPWRESPWMYMPGPLGRPEHEGWRHGGDGRTRWISARDIVPELQSPGRRDLILSCFFRPPAAWHEPPKREPWDRRWTGDTPWNPEDL